MFRKIVAVWVSLAMLFGFVVIVDVITDITPPVKAATLYVNTTGLGGAYTSIQDAINDSNDGDTVFVYNGTYFEHVIVNKTINLTGENMDVTIIDGGGGGSVINVSADWVNITGFTISNGNAGILLWSYSNSNITGNLFTLSDSYGLRIVESSNNSIMFNQFSDYNNFGIYFSSSSNNTIIGNYLSSTNFGYGMFFDLSSNNNITSNIFINNGIFIRGNTLSHYNSYIIPQSNTVNGKSIFYYKNKSSFELDGISVGQLILANCTDFTVKNLLINNTNWAIEIAYSSNIYITNNSLLSNEGDGIYMYSSSNNRITNNNISNNQDGINLLQLSNNNTIINNDVSSNSRGIHIRSSSGNQINNNVAIDNFFYGIELWWSSNNTIVHNNASSNGASGIALSYDSLNNRVNDNVGYDNEHGIRLRSSSHNNTIMGNKMYDNVYGIVLEQSNDNIIMANNASNNFFGIIVGTPNNEIIGNDVMWNLFRGITVYSSNNRIYHNNIIGNPTQAIDTTSNNNWDNGYPSGGNYWSDFDEPGEGAYDDYQGSDQDILGSDGIVDNGTIGGGGKNPYVIDADSQDNYPLMTPYPVIMDYENPTADAGQDQSIYEDEIHSFDGSNSYDNVGIINWTWDFDDGTFGYGINPAHSYQLSGEYFVLLNVTDEAGNWDTDIVIINVFNVPPIANTGNDISAYEEDWITFNGSGSTDTLSDMDSLVYIWDFGDANNGSGITIVHIYNDNGVYNVTLNVTDDDGNTSIDKITVTIYNTPPQILLIPTQILQEDEPYNLQVNATDIGADTITYADNTSLFDIDPFTGYISFTPTNNDVGVHLINITAMDDDGGLSYLEILMDIQNTNDAPVITSTPETIVWEKATYYYNVTAIDDDNDPINYREI